MRINADSNNDKNETKSSFTRLHNLLCYISIYKVVLTTVIVGFVLLLLYICKTYIRTILLWLEKQDSVIIAATILVLFILVSFPVSIGYIVLVTASGYLFNIKNGLLLSVIGANVGLLIAHNVIKLLGHHNRIRKFMDMEIAKAITRVIAGPLSFKIVLCARITPIPFGFQNTIFALSNVYWKTYHIASFIGLLPAQVIATTVGSTLRSMQDVFESKEISTTTYVFITLQLLFGISVMAWVTAKARKELLKALNEANTKYGLNSNFNIV